MSTEVNKLKHGIYELNFNNKEAPTKVRAYFFSILTLVDEGKTMTHQILAGYKIYILKKRRKNSLVSLLKKHYGYDETHSLTVLLVSIDGDRPIIL